MSLETMIVEVANVIRQVNSPSGVLGKQLVNESNGHNRFVLVLEYPDGTRKGAIYRVQRNHDGSNTMFRDVITDIEDLTHPFLKGAPTYKWEDLGDKFWIEQF